MSNWIQNLRMALLDNPVVLLHGNVRDRYIGDNARVYENLTELLTDVARGLPDLPAADLVFYDPAGVERWVRAPGSRAQRPLPGAEDLAGTVPGSETASQSGACANAERSPEGSGRREEPRVVLPRWAREMSDPNGSRFSVLFYLDKIVSYRAAYSEEEAQCIFWLEKAIENITPNHRLVMVALQDTMVPVEIYTQSPKCRVIPIPMPDKADRYRYIRQRLGDHEHLDALANLTDGLYLRDLHHVAEGVRGCPALGHRELGTLINRYRIGIEKNYWGELSIVDLNAVEERIGRSDDERARLDARLNASGQKITENVRAFDPVKGQDEAIRKIVDLLCRARAGLSGIASGTSSKPKGVLFFAGTTGTGKTFLAKKLARFLFGTEEAFIRIDMSELMEEHSVSKLIGSPPGYIGSDRGGTLTNAVRERPFSVVLFDEVEKAHPKILDVFLQILDEGRLTDSRGQTVFFTETVLIFTSNVGCRTTDSKGRSVVERQNLDLIRDDKEWDAEAKQLRIREHFVHSVEQFFTFELSRPELLNRIGSSIVPFNYIHNPDIQREIVGTHLRRIREDFEDKYRPAGYRLLVEGDVIAFLVSKHGTQMAQNGGRGITNAIEDEVVMALARAVLRAEHEGTRDAEFRVSVHGGGLKVQTG